jgi:hypothetical protein
MIKGKQAVTEYFEQINAGGKGNIYFSIYKNGKESTGTPCIKTPDTEGWNYDQAFQFLQRWLGFQQYGDFTLYCNDKPRTLDKGSFRQDFSLSMQDSAQPQVSGPAMSQAEINDQITARVGEILDKKEKEKELADLKVKVVELEKENKVLTKRAEDPWTSFIAEIKPYIPAILQDQGIIKTQVAGPNTAARQVSDDTPATDIVKEFNDQNDENAALQKRFEIVVGKFVKARPDDYMEVMEYFAKKVEGNPGLVEMAKKFLGE